VPVNPISSATKGPGVFAAVTSQVEPIERLAITQSPHSLGVKHHDLIEAGSRRGLIPIQWFQVEHESGQEDLGIGENFGLDYRVLDPPHLCKTPHHCPHPEELSFVHLIKHSLRSRFLWRRNSSCLAGVPGNVGSSVINTS
jgi:hypothetical protein